MVNNATKKPGDFVIATGKQRSVRQFIELAAKELGIKIRWKGKGIKEKGYDQKGNCIVECNKKYFRPLEVDTLKGDARKAKKILKWTPKISFEKLVKEMVREDLRILQNS